MKARLARWLRKLADWLHRDPPRDERGRFQFQTGRCDAVVNRVWIDGAPFVREPKPLPVVGVDIDAVHKRRKAAKTTKGKR